MHTLYWSGAVGKIEHGVKLLADVRMLWMMNYVLMHIYIVLYFIYTLHFAYDPTAAGE